MLSALGLLGLIGAASAQSSAGFRVRGGDCYVDGNGCVTDGYGNYENNERCTVEITQSGVLSIPSFDVDSTDYWTVDGISYSLDNLEVYSGSSMSWYSDSRYTRSGYVICLLTTPADTSTTGLWDAATMTGPCELDSDGCWTDGAGSYGNNERCSICTRRSGYVSAVGVLNTEGRSYDYLTISGNNYGGEGDEPDNVYIISNDCVYWQSDSTVTGAGWSLCEVGTLTTAGTGVGGSTSDDDDDSSFPVGSIVGVFFVIIIVVAIAQAIAQKQKQAQNQARIQQAQNRTPAYQNGAFVAPKPVVTPWAAPTVAASASPYNNVAATGRAPTTTEYKAATTIQAGYRGHAVRKKMSQPRRSNAFGNRKPDPRTFATNGKFYVPVVQVDTGDPFSDLGDPFATAMTDMETLDNYSSRNQGGYPNSHLIPRSSDAVVPAYRPPPKPWLTAPY